MSKKIVFIALTLACALSCKKNEDSEESVSDATSNAVQVSVSEAGSQASASEGGAAGFIPELAQEVVYLDPADKGVQTQAACNYSTVRSSCSSNSTTVTWNSCTVASGAVTMTGGWTETFSGTGASSCTVPVASGGTVTRTSSSSVMTINTGALAGATITTNTTAHSTWDNVSIPSTGISVSNSSGTRTVTINGVHRVMRGPRGRMWFDHSLKTTTDLTVTGDRASGNRAITAGVLKVYHNLLQYNATNTFNNVTWGSSSCCYPTSGNISTSFSGSVTGTTTLTFTTTCGSATFVDTSGSSSTVALTQCN